MNRALAVLVLALAVYAGTVTWFLQRERTRATSAVVAGERAAMASAGAVVQKPAPAADVRDAAKPVRAQVDRVVAACPAARTTEVVTWQVDPVVIPAPPAPVEAASRATLPPVAPVTEIQVRGTEARLETAEGAVSAVGEVEVWRTRPEPEELLGRRPWRADLSRLLRVEPVAVHRPARWMAGPAIAWTRSGVAYGAAIVTPPVRVFGADAAAWVTGAAGHRDGIAMVGVLVGW